MAKRSVFCIATSRGRADRIIHDLKTAEFAGSEVSILFRDHSASLPAETETTVRADRRVSAAAAESAGEVRGVMRWIAGIARLVVPGIGTLIAAGPLAEAVRGAAADGVTSGLTAFGVPLAETTRYAARIRDGHTLIAIHTDNPDKSDRAREIFTAASADDLCTMMEVTTPRTPLLGPHRINRLPIG